jgi:hypothetical protein
MTLVSFSLATQRLDGIKLPYQTRSSSPRGKVTEDPNAVSAKSIAMVVSMDNFIDGGSTTRRSD